MTNLSEYMNPMTSVFCLATCYVIKTVFSGNAILKRLLPAIAALIGAVVMCVASKAIDPPTILTGLISGLAASGGYDVFDNWIKKPEYSDFGKTGK